MDVNVAITVQATDGAILARDRTRKLRIERIGADFFENPRQSAKSASSAFYPRRGQSLRFSTGFAGAGCGCPLFCGIQMIAQTGSVGTRIILIEAESAF